MPIMRLDSRDAAGFKVLFSIAIMYGLISALVYSVIHMHFVKPLGFDAPLDRFSEARAVEHVRVLADDIGGRQVGRDGLRKAAMYIKSQLEMIKERAGPDFRIQIEESYVNGSFNMMFLGHSLSLTYRNHTNIVMRISSAESQDTDPSVLINAHFDSPVGSPGAGDCGSCVASLLELARLTVDSGWVPPQPIIFLLNGAEELYMLGAHGFMTTHKWRDSIGVSINVEASGTGGLDLVCQSGPTSWPSIVYAQSAVYPMADSAAQDVFPVIPGDTDYRIFSQDYGNIPSLDIIFLLGGYFYHTSFDTVDRLLPGSMQARGENLFNVLKGFSSSSELSTARSRLSNEVASNERNDEKPVFFDYLTWFMVLYSRRVALLLHSIPVAIFLSMPLFLHLPNPGLLSLLAAFYDFLKGMLFHAAGIILAIVIPIIFSILRLSFSSYGMCWFAHPYLAFMMFVPCSVVGLLIPRMFWCSFPLSQDGLSLRSSKEALSDEARFWGAFGFYALVTLAYLVSGLSGGFFTFTTTVFMLPSWICFGLATKRYGRQSLRSTAFYVIPLIPFLIYSVYFGGFFAQFVIERMGMMGSIPPPFGYLIADIIVAAIIGVVTGWCAGPLIPICGNWLARSAIVQVLLHVTVLAMAISSQFFPYGTAVPKRIIFQHTYVTAGLNRVVNSSYEFAVVDSNSLSFVFKHAPEVTKELQIDSEMSFESLNMSQRTNWMATYPLSFLFSGSLKFPANSDAISKRYRHFPCLSNYKPDTLSGNGYRRVHLELILGDLEEVWVTVLNITGPLSSWSFADNVVAAAETLDNGPPSYICRLSGSSHEKWTFWLEASSSDDLRVEVAVLDQVLVDEANKLKDLFPNWVDVIAYSSFMSTYKF